MSVPDLRRKRKSVILNWWLPLPSLFRFRAIAGFRNLLVHGYIEVDIPRLHQLLNQRLDDFAEFAAKITAHLDRVQ
jgi:uncharacterized protein YutE (UPF0331/DUF86 family)